MGENDRSRPPGPTVAKSSATVGDHQGDSRPQRRRQRRSWGSEDGSRGFRVTATDQAYLVWLVRVRYATAPQIARRFRVGEHTAYYHLQKLRRAGLVVHTPIVGSPLGLPPLAGTMYEGNAYGVFRATAAGCGFVGSPLRPPTFAPGSYWHTLGLVDLTVDFELEGRRVLTEREIRGMDPDPRTGRVPYAIPVGAADQGGGKPKEPFLHYPDLVLPRDDGRVVVVEFEISRKWASKWRAILKAYGRLAVGPSPLVAEVLYFVPRTRVAMRDRLVAVARQTRTESLVFIRPFPVRQEDLEDGGR
jgi:Helix-turn-helix domain